MKKMAAAALCLCASLAQANADETQTFNGDYTVTFLGITVAKSHFTSTISGNQVTVNGNLNSAGIGAFFDSTTASSSFNGQISDKAIVPVSFHTNYTSGKKQKSTSISFSGGNVVKTVNVPPLKKRAKWVPLKAGDLNGVLDPLSATLVRAGGPNDVCRRTLKVYDGEMRANLVLSPASTGKVPGFGPEAATCSAKFVPVSGYRPDSKSLAYLKNQSKIMISFAPLGQTGIYAPVRATIGTKVGTVTIVANQTKG